MSRYLSTVYSYQAPRGLQETFEARSDTEARNRVYASLRDRQARIRAFAATIQSDSRSETKRRRKQALGQIGWLHSTVERLIGGLDLPRQVSPQSVSKTTNIH